MRKASLAGLGGENAWVKGSLPLQKSSEIIRHAKKKKKTRPIARTGGISKVTELLSRPVPEKKKTSLNENRGGGGES